MGAGNQQGAHRYWNETRRVLETNEVGNKVGSGKKRVGTGKDLELSSTITLFLNCFTLSQCMACLEAGFAS